MNNESDKKDELTSFQADPNMISDDIKNTSEVKLVPEEVKDTTIVNEEPIVEEKEEEKVSYDYPFVEDKKSKAPLLITIIIVLLLVGSYFLYQNTLGKPYKMILEGVSKEIKLALNNYGKYTKVSGELDFEPIDKQLNFLTNLSLNYDSVVNSNDKEASFNMTLLDKSKEILSGNFYFGNDTMYMKSPQLLKQTLYDKDPTYSGIFEETYSKEDIDHYVDLYSRIIVEGLKNEKNNKSSVNLNIDSKTIKATANTYIVDKNNIARVSYNAFEEVKKDNKALEAMAKMQNKSVEEIKEIFTVDKNENVSDWKDKYALTFYTKGFLNQFLGFAFSINDQKIIEVLVKDEYNVITYCDKDNCIEAEGKIDNLKYVYKVKGKESFSGSIVTYSENSFAITAEMDKLFIAKLTAKLESDDKVTPIDTEKAIDYNSLTEKDKEAINEKLVNTILNSESLTKLIMLINSEEESQNL